MNNGGHQVAARGFSLGSDDRPIDNLLWQCLGNAMAALMGYLAYGSPALNRDSDRGTARSAQGHLAPSREGGHAGLRRAS